MSGAEKRISELLDRWLASLDLHAGYLELDDAAYARVQPWPPHERPTRWILDLARTRILDLESQLADRRAGGDLAIFESLELMGFLTTLLGSEHIQRSIPLAQPAVRPEPEPPPPVPTAPPPPPVPDKVAATVIADARRFLDWGREWPQLAGLISRLANRPSEDEVWNILRAHRAEIDAGRKAPR
jgi:hypothetical protein